MSADTGRHRNEAFVAPLQPGDKPSAVPLRILPLPVPAATHRSWRDLDGSGPFLVQTRTASGLKKWTFRPEHIDQWHFRIIHVMPHSNAKSHQQHQVPLADLEYGPGKESTTEIGHERNTAMHSAARFTVAVATSEAAIVDVWSALSCCVQTAGFRIDRWDGVIARHVCRHVFARGTPWPVLTFRRTMRDPALGGSPTSPERSLVALSVATTSLFDSVLSSISLRPSPRRNNGLPSRSHTRGSLSSLASLRDHFYRPAVDVPTTTTSPATSGAGRPSPATAELRALHRPRSTGTRPPSSLGVAGPVHQQRNEADVAIVVGDKFITVLPAAARLSEPAPFPVAVPAALVKEAQPGHARVTTALDGSVRIDVAGDKGTLASSVLERGVWSAPELTRFTQTRNKPRFFGADDTGMQFVVMAWQHRTGQSYWEVSTKDLGDSDFGQFCRSRASFRFTNSMTVFDDVQSVDGEAVDGFHVTASGKHVVVSGTAVCDQVPGNHDKWRWIRIYDSYGNLLRHVTLDEGFADAVKPVLRVSHDGQRIALLVGGTAPALAILDTARDDDASTVLVGGVGEIRDMTLSPRDNAIVLLTAAGSLLQLHSQDPLWHVFDVSCCGDVLQCSMSPDGGSVYVLARGEDTRTFCLWLLDEPAGANGGGVATSPPRQVDEVRSPGNVTADSSCAAHMCVTGSLLVVHVPGNVAVFSLYAASTFTKIPVNPATLAAKAVSPNGSLLAVTDTSGTLTVFTLRNSCHGERQVFRREKAFGGSLAAEEVWFDFGATELTVCGRVTNAAKGRTGTVAVRVQLRNAERSYVQLSPTTKAEVFDLFEPAQAAWVPHHAKIRVGFVHKFPCTVAYFDDSAVVTEIYEAAQAVPAHPHIVEVLGTMAGADAIVFESMACSLLDYLRAHRTAVSFATLVEIFTQVADALAELHAAGRAHTRLNLHTIAVSDAPPNAPARTGQWVSTKAQLEQLTRPHFSRDSLGVSAASSPSAIDAEHADASLPADTVRVPASFTNGRGLVAKLTNMTASTAPNASHEPRPVTGEEIADPFIRSGRLDFAKTTLLKPPTAEDDVWALGKCMVAALHLAASNDRDRFDTDTMQWIDGVGAAPIGCDGAERIPPSVWHIARDCLREDAARPDAAMVHWNLHLLLLNGGVARNREDEPLVASLPAWSDAEPFLPWSLLPRSRRPASFSGLEFTSLRTPWVRQSRKLPRDHAVSEYLRRVAFPAASARVEERYGVQDWSLSLLWCPRSADLFAGRRSMDADALASNPHIRNTTALSEAGLVTLARLDAAFVDSRNAAVPPRTPQPRILFAWRSAQSLDEAYAIARDGPRPMSKLDNGYFAKGIYFALEPAIAASYLDPDSRDGVLMLFAISIAQPYPVTLEEDYTMEGQGFSSLRGGAMKLGHDAHFVPVYEYGHRHPLNPDVQLEHAVHFQCADVESVAYAPEGHELCVEHAVQVAPVALLKRQ